MRVTKLMLGAGQFFVVGQLRPNCFHERPKSRVKYRLAALPALCRVDRYLERVGEALEAVAVGVPYLFQFSAQRFRLVGERVIAEELDDGGIVLHLRLASAVFPIGQAVLANAKRRGDLPLQEAAFDALLAEVFANGLRFGIVSLRKRLFRTFNV